MTTSDSLGSIFPCWCVEEPGIHLCITDTSFQLLGVAHALKYLHTYQRGPIFHGDVRGVRRFNISACYLTSTYEAYTIEKCAN